MGSTLQSIYRQMDIKSSCDLENDHGHLNLMNCWDNPTNIFMHVCGTPGIGSG